MKLTVAIASNLAFLPAVVLLWALELPMFASHQLRGIDLIAFVIGELLLVVYYGLLLEPEASTTFLDLLTQAARSGVPATDGAGPPESARQRVRLHRLITNLWTPVTLNFWLVGWLIYATGGITKSPYSGVPLSMIIIGQSVYAVPPMELRPSGRVPRLLVFLWSVGRLYSSSLLVVVSLLVTLVLLGSYLPVERRSAPTGEILLVMLVSLFASMCVTFVTRRNDQHHRERQDG